MSKLWIVRQSAVVPSDYSRPKNWREMVFFNWAIEDGREVSMVISGFDHYAKRKRKKLDFPSCNKVRIFRSPGYKKNTSIFRVLDAWIFSIQLLFFSLKKMKRNDVVVCSLPTPESASVLALSRKICGFSLVVDVRDVWPDSHPNEGVIKKLFGGYVRFLNNFVFSNSSKVSWMSEGLRKRHSNIKSLFNKSIDHIVLPITFVHREENKMEAGDLYKLVNAKPCVVFFGTLNSQFDFFPLEELRRKDDIFHEFNFIIAGSGENLSQLKRKFHSDKNVHFLGHIDFDKTVYISKHCSGFFLFYSEPHLYENHITNKCREYAEYRKPIIHNLPSNKFTLADKSFRIGVSIFDSLFGEILRSILNEDVQNTFHLKELDNFCKATSENNLRRIFLEMIDEK